ncbi:MaoC family dehydratase N-terminal domain-containing protein [Sphingobium sp. Sx8-8]|uniref:FAS1-like dehydratase domain-containing protein n=1 Tax=Sphingobium sp. Sx8-8 TaxID=2933617 RepID=UPI001F5ABAEF|nr:MaoC family dehydratase N-terminal domain-containing protein [Sphingobium sp. Sx8-8]
MADVEPQKSLDIDGKITDADIERARKQIGIPQKRHTPTFNMEATADTMRHFAFGLAGDDNPLWHDPDYARGTRWRGLIAHPLYVQTMGINETTEYSPEVKPLFKGLFRGVGKYLAGTDWTFFRPVFPGDVAYEEYITSAIEEKVSSFSGGRSVIDSYRSLFVDRAGLPIAMRETSAVNAERRGSKEAGKYKNVERHSYTPDDIARIDEIYAAEVIRGAEPRWWEDVEPGQELTPIAKGPLTMVDLISRHIATGMADGYDIGPLRYGWKARRRMPAFYTNDRWGVPQVAQRVHWDESRAQDLGLPTGYDYAILRFAWLIHLATNWMGDDAWLWRYSVELRRFNFLGDLQVCKGEVVEKGIEDGRPFVKLALRAENQNGEQTTAGSATIILPSREHGPVVLPTPGPELLKRGAEMLTRGLRR